MCGIAGVYRFDNGAVEQRTLRHMADSLRHRGPDDFGVYAKGPIGLAHTRLSVIDLSSLGRQPMLSDDGMVALAYNGEMYNFPTLRADLERIGHVFRGGSDTEVVLRAYMQWGVRAFRHLEGMFAFALWDGHEQRLHLVRDRFGIKPLYYRHTPGALTFGSEVKAILAAGGASVRAEFAGLHEFLYFGAALGKRTMFEGVEKLLPGHSLVVGRHGIRCQPYYSIPERRRDNGGFDVAVETVRGLFGESVRSHLVSDVPVGIYLSGGVDSSAITAIASEHYGSVLRTFTATFDDDQTDELSQAREVAERFGTEHHEVRIRAEDARDVIETLVECHDEPFGDPASIALFLLSQQVAGTAKVILQGDGGDEMFGGYRRHGIMQHLFWWRLLSRSTRLVHGLMARMSGEDMASVVFDALSATDGGMVMPRLLASESPRRPPTRLFSRDFRSHLLASDPFYHHRQMHDRFSGYDATRRLIALDTAITLPEIFFEKVDKAAMHHGIEVRVPMVDRRLAEYAMNLPSAFLVRRREQKVVLRAALRGIVPDAALDHPKKGLDVPIGDWLRVSLEEYAKSVFFDRSTRDLGIFDETAVGRCLEEHRAGRFNHGRLIYKLMQFGLWCRVYRPSFDRPRAAGASSPPAMPARRRTSRQVAFVVSGLERGGAETQVVGLATGLMARGWGVTVISYLSFSDSSLVPELQLGGVRVISLDARGGALRYASMLRAASVIRRVKPDVLVGVMFHGMMTVRLLGRSLGIAMNVSSVHSDRHGPVRERLLRLTRSMTDAVVTLSPSLGGALVRRGVAKREHLHAVPNAIDIDRFEQVSKRVAARQTLGFGNDNFLWLAAGRLEVEKDYPNMLRAFRQLANACAHAMLIIAGDGRQAASLSALIERLGLSGRVRLLGLRDDIPELLAASDALVLSSAWEGMPVAVLEAMAGHRPVVATAVGAIPDLIDSGRTGFLVPIGDSAALARAMMYTMQMTASARASLVGEAHSRLRGKCSTPIVLDQWEALIDRFFNAQ